MERARCFSRQGKRLSEIAKGTKDEVQLAIHRTVRNVLELFMPDVKMEIFRKTRDLVGTDATVAKTWAAIETSTCLSKAWHCPRGSYIHAYDWKLSSLSWP
ncbi:hypothetical protein PsorP6_001637 [Peronosclerospora sorghi]|uniref:Uncharacterized protein n=1 Tax=Peronosclerospora sorghi TaxID=230839 RepID=A0ACC0WP91_9STRA|nr:hypothetical protein PsorP6_001637 [Peronosclerospora sorghi]